jgi:hypothetical protein
MSLKQLLAT